MDARAWSRHLVEKDVTCTLRGRPLAAFLYDLSGGGCMIELGQDGDALGEPVEMRLHGDERVRGIVVWQTGRCSGVRFDAVLHEAVVRHLGFTPPTVPFEDQAPRDRFGRMFPPLDVALQDGGGSGQYC